jgi:hypothetical protein
VNYVGFQKEVRESLIREIFGEPDPEFMIVQENNEPGSPASSDENPTEERKDPALHPEAPDPAPTPEAPKPEPRLAIPSRSGLMARLRARTNAANSGSTPKP